MNTPKPDRLAEVRREINARVEPRVKELATFALFAASNAGICPCKVFIAADDSAPKPPPGKPEVFTAVVLITAPMAEADQRRIADFAQGMIQDLGQGFAVSKQVNIDTITKPEGTS